MSRCRPLGPDAAAHRGLARLCPRLSPLPLRPSMAEKVYPHTSRWSISGTTGASVASSSGRRQTDVASADRGSSFGRARSPRPHRARDAGPMWCAALLVSAQNSASCSRARSWAGCGWNLCSPKLAGPICGPAHLQVLSLFELEPNGEDSAQGSTSLRWWRRWESNPRPENASQRFLRA